MPELVTTTPAPWRGGKDGNIKPEWLDGKVRKFKRGPDFEGRPEEFSRQFRKAAQKRGLHGRCVVLNDDEVQAQAY